MRITLFRSLRALSRSAAALALIGPFGFALRAAQPTEARGPLRLHPTNPRYFADGTANPDGSLRAVYLAGSHIWHSFQDHGHRLESGVEPPLVFDFDGFLNLLQANGHNFTRLWRWELPKWTEGDTKTKQTEYSQPHPWRRTGPGLANDGKPKFDLTRFDEAYFSRLRTRVQQAGARGVYVAVMLFECWGVQHADDAWRYHPFAGPNNVNGMEADEDGDGRGVEVHSLRDTAVGRRALALHEAYVRRVLETLNDLDNVLYEIGNEGGKYSEAWQNHLVGFIHRTEAAMPRRHLVGVTFHFSKDRAQRGNNRMLFESPADWVSPGNEPAAPGVAFGFNRNPTPVFPGKVVVADTDHLGWNAKRDEDWAWKQFMRGNHTWYLEWAYASPTEAVAVRRGLGQTVRWAREVDLASLEPSITIASTPWCLAAPGREYLVYQPQPGPFTVELAGSGTYAVSWFSPATGVASAGGEARGGGRREFTAPHGGPAVLHLRARP